jgi:glutaconate CoA-transferase subunit A
MNKVKTAKQVVSQLQDGMTIGIGGWGPRRKPMALIREIVRSNLKDLTIVSYGGADVGMLCGAGKVKKVIFAFVSLDFIPLEPFFRQAREKGELEIMEIDEGMLLLGLRAAAWGCPYIPTQVGLGTDVIKHNPDIKVIDSPYDDKEWLAMPALKLDAALVHVDSADERGVCRIAAPDHHMDDWFVRAAKHAYVSCDEIVQSDHFNPAEVSRQVFWERSLTTAVCHIPGGAHPSSCSPFYGIDNSHFLQYNKYAKDGGFDAYREKFINGKTEEDYQALLGGIGAIRQIPQTSY